MPKTTTEVNTSTSKVARETLNYYIQRVHEEANKKCLAWQVAHPAPKAPKQPQSNHYGRVYDGDFTRVKSKDEIVDRVRYYWQNGGNIQLGDIFEFPSVKKADNEEYNKKYSEWNRQYSEYTATVNDEATGLIDAAYFEDYPTMLAKLTAWRGKTVSVKKSK